MTKRDQGSAIGKVYSLATQQLHNQGDYSVSHRDAEGNAKYIAFRIWHQRELDKRDGINRSDARPAKPRRPSGLPTLTVAHNFFNTKSFK
jgi:hypothetical protein